MVNGMTCLRSVPGQHRDVVVPGECEAKVKTCRYKKCNTDSNMPSLFIKLFHFSPHLEDQAGNP